LDSEKCGERLRDRRDVASATEIVTILECVPSCPAFIFGVLQATYNGKESVMTGIQTPNGKKVHIYPPPPKGFDPFAATEKDLMKHVAAAA
jgi:hypothetical protein